MGRRTDMDVRKSLSSGRVHEGIGSYLGVGALEPLSMFNRCHVQSRLKRTDNEDTDGRDIASCFGAVPVAAVCLAPETSRGRQLALLLSRAQLPASC